MIHYFNYTNHIAEDWWSRRDFIKRWWRLGATDVRWTPPYYPSLRHALVAARDGYLAERTLRLLYIEALPRRVANRATADRPDFTTTAWMEEAVAATVILFDRRRRDNSAYLSLLQCVNDSEVMERLLGVVMEQLSEMGCERIIGPTGLSPHLQAGALQDYFHVTPPLHTPYNPPYLPELLESNLQPLTQSRLFSIPIPPHLPEAGHGVATLEPLIPARLSGDLLPLLATACTAHGDFPPPDGVEAAFLLRWLAAWPLSGWLAQVDDKPVGFILLQPDLAGSVQRAHGGRSPLWWLWLTWRSQRPVRTGRLLYGAVLPAWRNQGIGQQLWRKALDTAQQVGWQTLTIGPVTDATPGAAFLGKQGAQAQQKYRLYSSEW